MVQTCYGPRQTAGILFDQYACTMGVCNMATIVSNGSVGMIDTRRPAIITEALIEHVHWFFPDQQESFCELTVST